MLNGYRWRLTGGGALRNVARPSIGDVIGSAFKDAPTLLRARRQLWLRFALVAAAGGAVFPWLEQGPYVRKSVLPVLFYREHFASTLLGTLTLVAWFFVVASALRTIRPAWRWDIVAACGVVLIVTLLALLAVPAGLLWSGRKTLLIAELVLFLPGLFLAIRWSQAPWCFLLDNGANPFGESWRITSGVLWLNLLFFVFRSILAQLSVTMLGVKLALAVPLAAVVILPLGVLVAVLLTHFSVLCDVRWLLALRARAAVTSQHLPAGVTAL